MEIEYPTIDEPATPEYVLGVLRDIFHQYSLGLPQFSFDTTIDYWDLAMDFDDWRDMARSMNGFWGIDCPLDEWRAVVLPMESRPIRGVCELIARYAKRPRLQPLQWLGRDCLPGGAFLTIRSFLHRAGCNVKGIAPSTPIAQVAILYRLRLVSEVARLAPAIWPYLRVWTPGVGWAIFFSIAGGVAATFGLGYSTLLAVLGSCVMLASLTYLTLAAFQVVRPKIEFGELQTFRDLAVAIAKHQERTES